MTLQSIVYQVCDEVGLNRPGAIVAATDTQTMQLRALLLRSGQKLVERYEWSGLIVDLTFPTVISTPNYAMPADFNRFVDDTQWNQSNRVPLFGPQNQQDWAQNEFGMINVGPFFRQQLRGSSLWLQPTPQSVQNIGQYYVSNYWIQQAAGPLAATFASDNDTFPAFTDELLCASLKWRWLRAKGLSYDEEKDDYQKLLAESFVQDRGSRNLSLDPQREQFKPRYGFVVPITGFGQ
jgi:hypothetical protein